MEVELWWIGAGTADEARLDEVAGRVAGVFGLPVSVRRPSARPSGTFDARRRQHSSARVLSWLDGMAEGRTVAVTDVDLFMPVLTFVFGEAQLGGRCAVVSTARLARGAEQDAVRWSRLAKEVVHELGHTFGLLHCDRPGCAMHRSAGLRDVDHKEENLCPECHRRLREAQEHGEKRHDHPSTHAHPGGG
jgi:archaemetzincin